MATTSITARAVLAGAMADLRRSWSSLAQTDLAYKLLAFALLTPGTSLVLRWIRSGSSAAEVVADTDILRFFVTTRIGVLTLVLGASLILAITALEAACLMGIAMASARGLRLDARSALLFGAKRAPDVLRLTAHIVVRVVALVVPFLLSLGLVYWAFLRGYDINFYLAQRPSEFWIAAVLVAALVLTLGALLLRIVSRWALALPLVLFEGVPPRRALGESARRTSGKRAVVLAALGVWGAVAIALLAVASALPEALGRAVAARFAGSLSLLVLFVSGLALFWGALVLAAGVANFSLFGTIVARLYLNVGDPRAPRAPEPVPAGPATRRLPRSMLAAIAAVLLLAALGAVALALVAAKSERPVLVIAHRGASAAAPENTLAAFRLATEQGADLVELDVQESADGEVLVVHDSDLMKVGGVPAKIWDTDAATLRAVDVGSHAGPEFARERVPTLAEALAACQGRSRVLVELKSYGHDQRLEERVAEIVEAAGMERDCVFMSLDHEMVRKMKRLRPEWRVGVLAAKAFGDLTRLDADFLAVESKIATRRFVRRAHRAGQDVYVWTVNDPAAMFGAMSRGVDGLITDQPDLARRAVARREEMSDAQRLLVAALVRLGVRTDQLVAEEALRP